MLNVRRRARDGEHIMASAEAGGFLPASKTPMGLAKMIVCVC